MPSSRGLPQNSIITWDIVSSQIICFVCAYVCIWVGFPGGTVVKNKKIHLPMQETWVNPWFRKILWRRKWQPTPVFLPGKSHGRRSLAGYSPQDCEDSDTNNEHACAHIHMRARAYTQSFVLKKNVCNWISLKQWFSNLNMLHPEFLI